jgi:integrase
MVDMPIQLPPHVHVQRSRHGKVVFYFRRGHGKRTRLPLPTDKRFEVIYAQCLAGQAPRYEEEKAGVETMAWLVQQWRQSSDWLQTSVATRKQRENILKHVLEKSGKVPFRAITAAHIRQGREDRMATPAAANNFLKTMRALFGWAKDAQHVRDNPAEGVKFLKVETEGFIPWTMKDVERYRARWPLGTRPRLAFEILFNTGLRRGDAVRLGRQHVRDDIAFLKAEKTGVDLTIPVNATLRQAIEAGPCGDLAFISSATGRPLAKESFGNFFREWCEAAGVKASAHGIRKLAASLLAERGGSEEELQAYFGWQSVGQSAVYTKAASRKAKALNAARKLSGNIPSPSPSLTQEKVREG